MSRLSTHPVQSTRKRKAFHVLNRLDSVGGDSTHVEETWTTRLSEQHLERAVGGADMLPATFPVNEIKKERDGLDDSAYLDSPADSIFDDSKKAVEGHPMGGNSSATPIRRHDRATIEGFVARLPPQKWCSVVGLPRVRSSGCVRSLDGFRAERPPSIASV